jgi:peptidoglycan-associated lipoprotein
MKKLLLSFILVNLLAACAIRTPFDSPAALKQDSAATVAATEPVKTDAVTTPDVNANTLDKAANPEAVATTASVEAAPKAEATGALPVKSPSEVAPKAGAVATAEEAAPKAESTETTEAPQPLATAADQLEDPASALSKRSIHFPFAVDVVQESDKATIKAHGAYLAKHPERKIRVEGNTDERGSSEYNLALGQRRANNTKKALVLAGAKATQIEAISYGEEKPIATGHDETAWAQNRRTDITYK